MTEQVAGLRPDVSNRLIGQAESISEETLKVLDPTRVLTLYRRDGNEAERARQLARAGAVEKVVAPTPGNAAALSYHWALPLEFVKRILATENAQRLGVSQEILDRLAALEAANVGFAEMVDALEQQNKKLVERIDALEPESGMRNFVVLAGQVHALCLRIEQLESKKGK